MDDSFLPSPRGLLETLSRPENKAALQQFGVNLLRPMGWGESPAMAVGQAVGAGMEARDRELVGQQKMEQEVAKGEREQARLDLAESAAARRSAAGGLSLKDMFRAKQTDEKGFRSFVLAQAKEQAKASGDLLGGAEDDPFKGKTSGEIMQMWLSDPNKVKELRGTYDLLEGGSGTPSPALPPVDQNVPMSDAGPAAGVSRTTVAFIQGQPQNWAKIKAGLTANDPQVRAKAQVAVGQLKAAVTDPEVVDRMLAGG